MKSLIFRFFASLLFLFLFSRAVYAQQDIEKFRSILQMKNDEKKIEALYSFQKEYPQSSYYNRSIQEFFNVYLNMDQVDSALSYAHKFFQTIPEPARGSAYNSIAYALALKETGLDSALAYSSRAVDLTRAGNPRYLTTFIDTKAFVLYKKGDAANALELQKEAMKGNENNPEYLFHLALYLNETGNKEDALKSAAWAVINGDFGEALQKFNEWSSLVDSKIKEIIVMDAVQAYIDSSKGENELLTKSSAAGFMAQTGINLNQAKEWSENGLKSISKKTPVEEFINLKKNFAIVLAAEKKYEAALKELEEVKNLVDPWSGDYWLTLGKVYENQNAKEKAIDAYVSGLIGYNNPQVYDAAIKLTSESDIENRIEKMKKDLASFEFGEYKAAAKTTGKVVLAELFTGAECGPCVAADHAFDKLAEFYPRNAFVILEYHAHIPGPDPLTNPKGGQRYNWYGGDFGTPTVFFEGKEKIVGGGPNFLTANRFNVYNYTIKKYLAEQPKFSFSGKAKLNGGKIEIDLSVKPNENIKTLKPILHIALTEKSVKYLGANGVDKHIFVVRDLIDGVEGIPVSLEQEFNVSKIVDISQIEKDITDYLTDPTKDPSWKAPQFNGWRLSVDELNDIDNKNLAVIAWIQDDETKEVLQAHYFDVNE